MAGDDPMRFRIIGAERQTGDDVNVVVEAPDPAAAEVRAQRMQVLVERITEEPDELAPTKVPLVPHIRVDLDQGELEVRASIGRAGQLVRSVGRGYFGSWRRRTAVTSLAHLSAFLAIGWFGPSLGGCYPRGLFPPLEDVKQTLNEVGYYQVGEDFQKGIIRGRAAWQTGFVSDASQFVGVVNVYCALDNRSKVIAIASQYRHYSLNDLFARTSDKAFIARRIHAARLQRAFAQLVGKSPAGVPLLEPDVDSADDTWRGVTESRGFSIELLRWGEGEPDAHYTTDARLAIALDRSFR